MPALHRCRPCLRARGGHDTDRLLPFGFSEGWVLRTCASLLVALDVHPRVAMQILRHSQIAVTMNVYSEVYSAETSEALRRLGEHLGEEEV